MKAKTWLRRTLAERGLYLYATRDGEQFQIMNQEDQRLSLSEKPFFSWNQVEYNGVLHIKSLYYTGEWRRVSDFFSFWVDYLERAAEEQGFPRIWITNGGSRPLHDLDNRIHMLSTLIEEEEKEEWLDQTFEDDGWIVPGGRDEVNAWKPFILGYMGVVRELENEGWAIDHAERLDVKDGEVCYVAQMKKSTFQYEFVVPLKHEMTVDVRRQITDAINQKEQTLRLRHLLNPPRKAYDQSMRWTYHMFRPFAETIHAYLVERYDPLRIEDAMEYKREVEEAPHGWAIGKFVRTYVVTDGVELVYMGEDEKEARAIYKAKGVVSG